MLVSGYMQYAKMCINKTIYKAIKTCRKKTEKYDIRGSTTFKLTRRLLEIKFLNNILK